MNTVIKIYNSMNTVFYNITNEMNVFFLRFVSCSFSVVFSSNAYIIFLTNIVLDNVNLLHQLFIIKSLNQLIEIASHAIITSTCLLHLLITR